MGDATIRQLIASAFCRSLDAACFAGESATVHLAREQTWGKKSRQYSMQADAGSQGDDSGRRGTGNDGGPGRNQSKPTGAEDAVMKAVTKALARLGVPTNRDTKLSGDKAKSAPQGGSQRKQCSYCKKTGHEKDTCFIWKRDQKKEDSKDKDGASKQRTMTADAASNTDSEGSERAGPSDADPGMTIRAVPETSRRRDIDYMDLIEQDPGSTLLPYDVICPGPTFNPRDMPKGNPVPGNISGASQGDSEEVDPSGSP